MHEQNEICKKSFVDLEKKVDKMDTQIENIKHRLSEMPVMEEVISQVVDATEKNTTAMSMMSDAINNINISLIKIDHNMDNMANNQTEFAKKQEEMNKDIEALKEERTINLMGFIKKNFWKILVAGFFAYEVFTRLGI